MYFVIARVFCRISLFWGRRTRDKTGEDYRNLAATKRNTKMTHISHHMKVNDIIPFFLFKCVPNLLIRLQTDRPKSVRNLLLRHIVAFQDVNFCRVYAGI